MLQISQKIITCRALAHVLEKFVGTDNDLTTLEIGLHLQPERLRGAVSDKIGELERPGTTILLGYGLCGRALEGVFSRSSTLVLPRVDDCVGMLLGSRKRHKRTLVKHPGSYFLEPRWLDSELNIFAQMGKSLAHLPEERRRRLLKRALQHYERLVLLANRGYNGPALARCEKLAKDWDMAFQCMEIELGLVKRLLHGPWNEDEFVIATPGMAIPFF